MNRTFVNDQTAETFAHCSFNLLLSKQSGKQATKSTSKEPNKIQFATSGCHSKGMNVANECIDRLAQISCIGEA
jgi:hypothetical protein